MTTTSLKPVYHVRHDLQPDLTEELLILLWDKSPCQSSVLKQSAVDRGYRLAQVSPDQLLASLVNLRIVKHGRHSELSLTPLGILIAKTAKYNPDLLSELMHFTYYNLYDETTRSPRFSWSYRTISDYLWVLRSHGIEPHRLVALIHDRAQQNFADWEEYGVSFSLNSVNGILTWLEALNPPCILREGGKRTFVRRGFCPSEIMLLALERVAHRPGTASLGQLQLSSDVRRELAVVCLIEEDAVDEALQTTANAFSLVLGRTDRSDWITLPGRRSLLPFAAWQGHDVTMDEENSVDDRPV